MFPLQDNRICNLEKGTCRVHIVHDHKADRVARAAVHETLYPDEPEPAYQIVNALKRKDAVLHAVRALCDEADDDENLRPLSRMSNCTPAGASVGVLAYSGEPYRRCKCQHRLCPDCHYRLVRTTYEQLASDRPWSDGPVHRFFYRLPLPEPMAANRLHQIKKASRAKITRTLRAARALAHVTPALHVDAEGQVSRAVDVNILAAQPTSEIRLPGFCLACDKTTGDLTTLLPAALAYPFGVLTPRAVPYWPSLMRLFRKTRRISHHHHERVTHAA